MASVIIPAQRLVSVERMRIVVATGFHGMLAEEVEL
jgi:hypothetical protein